jgi:DUF1680 family protein
MPNPQNFPFHLRIPKWCDNAQVKVNGKVISSYTGNQMIKVERTWKSGDLVELLLPMHIFQTKWYENSMAVERGSITYALKRQSSISSNYYCGIKDPLFR